MQTITSISVPTGGFAPGIAIAWNDLNFESVTQEDDFSGTPGLDLMEGGADEDFFHSSEGRDTYRGRGGPYDQITFNADPGGVIVNLRIGIATDGWGDTDRLGGIEMLRGSAYADQLTGHNGNNLIRGLAGDDTLTGHAGNDTLNGGNGDDSWRDQHPAAGIQIAQVKPKSDLRRLHSKSW